MPKVIKELNKNIFNAAKNLFCTYGYKNVDMKMIAKECNIAVGTLYNYYSSKKNLYIEVLLTSWDNTYKKLSSIKNLDMSNESKMEEAIKILYEDIENRNGLGIELTKNTDKDLINDEKIINFKNSLINNIETLLNSLNGKNAPNDINDMHTRLSEILIINISIIIQSHPYEKEKNLYFLNKIIKSFC